jgi:hypothetical protein
MKRMLKRYLSLVALFSVAGFLGTTSHGYFRIRSQSFDSANFLVGVTDKIFLYDMGGFYGTFNFKFEYDKSFKGGRIARCLFGDALIPTTTTSSTVTSCNTSCNTDCNTNDCCNQELLIQGSCVASRSSNALLAEYFGLPTDFSSRVTFCPSIENFLFDFTFFAGFDEWLCGLWFYAHAPVVHARWKLNAREQIIAPGTNDYEAGYFSSAVVPRANLLNSFGEYASGMAPSLTGGVTYEGLKYSRFATTTSTTANCDDDCNTDCNRLSDTKLSDIHLSLGWNFWQDEDYHVGLGILFVAPTGTRVDNTNIFAPQIGNGHHFELGGVLTAHYTFWRGCDWDRSFSFHLFGQVTHMFKTCQIRSFDLCNSNCTKNGMSKYMLAEQMGALTVADSLRGNATETVGDAAVPGDGYTTATLQFQDKFVPVANLTTKSVDVSVGAQGDITALFNYTSCNFGWDFGYKFYGRTCEKFDCNPSVFAGLTNSYALKGDAYVYGFTRAVAVDDTITTTDPVALSATQSNACITGGLNLATITSCTSTDLDLATSIATLRRNPNIDNPEFAYGAAESLLSQPVAVATSAADLALAGIAQTRTSIQAVTLADANVAFNDARTKDATHTLFTHFNWNWDDYDCWLPYLGVGAKVEFAGNKNCGNTTSCSVTNTANCFSNTNCSDSCRRCGLTQWGVWIKGGVSFN